MKITQIYVYPIKTLRGIQLQQATLTRQGVLYDRRFMLMKVHDDGHLQPIEVVRFPECVLFIPEMVDDKIIVRYQIPEQSLVPFRPEHKTALEIPLEPDVTDLDRVEVDLYKSKCMGYCMPEEPYNSWFSACFGFKAILVYVGDGRRPVLGTMSPHVRQQQQQKQQQQGWLSSMASYITSAVGREEEKEDPHWLTFTGAAAYLILTEASVKDVSSRLPPGETMDLRKFRANIVVDGEEAYDEDFWADLVVGNDDAGAETAVRFALTGNCGRCISINVDYKTGRPGTGESGSVLKKLMKDRRVDLGNKYSPVFGRYGFLENERAEIEVGDEVRISRRLQERVVWDWPPYN